MPTLPTLTVTTAQASRILAAYKNQFGTTTQAETVAAYTQWLEDTVRQTVLDFERDRLRAAALHEVELQVAAMGEELPGAPPPPPPAPEPEQQALIDLALDALDPSTAPHPIEPPMPISEEPAT